MSRYDDFYWSKIAEEEFYLQYCTACRKFVFYPRSRCPHCLGSSLEWQELSGYGTLYSYSIIHVSALAEFNEEIPYIYAVIELDEGIKMPSNLEDCSLEEVRVGMPVEMTFIERSGRKLPVFKPA